MVGKILLGLLILLVAAFWVPVNIRTVCCNGEVTTVVQWLFFKIQVFPPGEEKPKKKKKIKAEAKPGEEPAKKPKGKNQLEFVFDVLQLINDIVPHAGKAVRYILKRVVLKRCRVTIVVAQEDAADTAIRYGQANAVFYNCYALLCSILKVREFYMTITPDYTSGPHAEKADADVTFSIRPGTVLAAAIIFLVRGGKIMLNSKVITGGARAKTAKTTAANA
ncbi:MAG: DUF2953 domain-containing protein [Angelakisella sp.]|nr:DUF2953 domain-containing protein [Angelakisella sp.]